MIRDRWGGAPWGAAVAEEGNLETADCFRHCLSLGTKGMGRGVTSPWRTRVREELFSVQVVGWAVLCSGRGMM